MGPFLVQTLSLLVIVKLIFNMGQASVPRCYITVRAGQLTVSTQF